MAKARLVRPETWTDEKFATVSPLARLLFIGMWNHACDNGHCDDSPLQLKMRILPADNCDAAELVSELVATGMVRRSEGYLKVVNLPRRQSLDLRYLVFCDHCEHDEARYYHEEDRTGGKGKQSPPPKSTPSAHSGDTAGTPHNGDVKLSYGDGDVGASQAKATRRKPEKALPSSWKPTQAHADYANKNSLDLSTQASRFRNHAEANDRRQRNWDATFRTWLSKAVEHQASAPKPKRTDLPEAWR